MPSLGIASKKHVRVEFEVEVKKVWTKDEVAADESARSSVVRSSEGLDPIQKFDDELGWNVYLELTNGKMIGFDFVVSATGVFPNGDLVKLAHRRLWRAFIGL